MIDLGPLGPLMWQGSLYLPFLGAAIAVALIRGVWDRPYAWIAVLTAFNWLGTRLVDCSEHGCGAIGSRLVAGASTEAEFVARIALGLQAVDLISIILLVLMVKILTFKWLLIAIYGCMVPFYLLAFVGWIDGATALTYVNGLGVIQLVLIVGASGGGSAVVDFGRRSSVHIDRHLARLDSLAAWLDAKTDLAGTPEVARRAG